MQIRKNAIKIEQNARRNNQRNIVETIAAIVTPSGKGGVGIVRVSGADVKTIAKALGIDLAKPRVAQFAEFFDTEGIAIDHGLAIYFVAPHSYTGEDVLELQGHGGPVVLQRVLNAVCAAGARLAKPGEFTERAFLNDKLDLAQAEAVADLIDATTVVAAKSAMKSLQGEFSQQIDNLRTSLIELQVLVEAAIDFPEEDIDFIQQYQVVERLQAIKVQLQTTFLSAQQGVILRDGITVVIAGRPNAGKSSLLNALSGRESAIVTEIAGTTRDVLREYIQIDGMPIHIVDTAGLRATENIIEQEGVKRARAEIDKADLILLVVDTTSADRDLIDSLKQETIDHVNVSVACLVVHNKIDLVETVPAMHENEITVSAKTSEGMVRLRDYLKQKAGYHAIEGTFIARARHIEALQQADDNIQQGLSQLEQHQASELLAEDIRQAQQSLAKITGEFSTDDLLGEIFSSFCIGK